MMDESLGRLRRCPRGFVRRVQLSVHSKLSKIVSVVASHATIKNDTVRHSQESVRLNT